MRVWMWCWVVGRLLLGVPPRLDLTCWQAAIPCRQRAGSGLCLQQALLSHVPAARACRRLSALPALRAVLTYSAPATPPDPA